MANDKISKDTVPEGFTLKLALVDAIPVILFGASMVVASTIFQSPLFLVGALLTLLAGAVKVLWKVIAALRQRNIWWMFIQMRIAMPIGFVMMIVGAVLSSRRVDLGAAFAPALHFPALAFFILGVLGMAAMGLCAARLDSSDPRANWIEQAINGISQLCIFAGLLFVALA